MSELSKLQKYSADSEVVVKNITTIMQIQYIELEDYKSQLALWDKYKDAPYDFFYDFNDLKFKDEFLLYLNTQNVNVKKVYVNEIPFNMGLSLNKKTKYFNDWLFNKLFKEE